MYCIIPTTVLVGFRTSEYAYSIGPCLGNTVLLLVVDYYIGVFWITLYPFDTVLPGTQKSRGLKYLTHSKRIYILKADIQGFPTVPGSRTGDKTGPLNFVSAQQCSARTGFNLSL